MPAHKPFLLFLFLMLSWGKAFATHYFGIDMFYTHISGNTYRLTIVSFGDCSGQLFPTFSTTRPRIYIRQGNTELLSDYLDQEAPKDGIEVKNGCSSEFKQSTCVDPQSTIPGVKKFIYSKEFTLPYTASDWKFVYLGETDGTTIAGRSNSLTNVLPPGIISLEATLDNTQYNNSSPQFNSIATQFYCINSPVEYDPAATDPDGDSIVYELIPGLNGAAQLNYKAGYSGSNPMSTSQGTFNFNQSTGLLKFTPNQLQKSLVVYRLSEYRNGVLIGTVMREMTMVVLPCDNNPPAGYISHATGADIVDSLTVETCIGNHEVTFDINPSDPNGHLINAVASNLPGNSKLDITDNNTANPKCRFVWNMPDLSEGDYKFNITYKDDGCPPTAQTLTYTIRIKPDDILAEARPAKCGTRGLLTVTPPSDWIPWSMKIYEDITQVYSLNRTLLNVWSDSLAVGKYRVWAVNELGCTAEAPIEIPTDCYVADIPTAFSPNGDGHNDILLVRGINIHEMHLRVYNRWGQLVFESRDQNNGWNGVFNGNEAPIESYAYVLSILFRNGETFQKQGNVTLLR